MRLSKLALALAAVTAIPANAVLMLAADVSGTLFNCVDQAPCDNSLLVGTISLPNGTTTNGVVVNGSLTTSTGTPANPGPQNILNTSSLSVTNLSGAPRNITVTVSDTNFTPVATQFALSGSGTFQNANGTSVLLRWWDDVLNRQGATEVGVTPGALIGMFTDTAVGVADAFAFNTSGTLAAPDLAPFSMTAQFAFTNLPAGGSILGRSLTEIKPFTTPVPEPATLLLVGGALALVGWRRKAK